MSEREDGVAAKAGEERRYRVYVIRLKRSVWDKRRKYREANPQYHDSRPHVYVGSTGKSPEERFRTHMEGGRGASSLVHRFGKRLLPWAYEKLPSYPNRESAEAAEEALAEKFRRDGWGVWCNAESLEAKLRRRVKGT